MSDAKTVPTVKLKWKSKGKVIDREIPLTVPASLGLRYEVQNLGKSEAKVASAALGLCSDELRGKIPVGHDLLAFGAKVLDQLLGKGIPFRQIIAAGYIAYAVISESLPADEEVAAAEDFFDPPTPEGSTP